MERRTVLVLAAIFVLSLPAVTVRIYATDEIQYFSYLRSLWFDHDVSFENEYRYFVETGPGAAPGFSETNGYYTHVNHMFRYHIRSSF